MIRDRLVCGIKDPRIQRRLLQEPDSLTYESAYKLAIAMEQHLKMFWIYRNSNRTVYFDPKSRPTCARSRRDVTHHPVTDAMDSTYRLNVVFGVLSLWEERTYCKRLPVQTKVNRLSNQNKAKQRLTNRSLWVKKLLLIAQKASQSLEKVLQSHPKLFREELGCLKSSFAQNLCYSRCATEILQGQTSPMTF